MPDGPSMIAILFTTIVFFVVLGLAFFALVMFVGAYLCALAWLVLGRGRSELRFLFTCVLGLLWVVFLSLFQTVDRFFGILAVLALAGLVDVGLLYLLRVLRWHPEFRDGQRAQVSMQQIFLGLTVAAVALAVLRAMPELTVTYRSFISGVFFTVAFGYVGAVASYMAFHSGEVEQYLKPGLLALLAGLVLALFVEFLLAVPGGSLLSVYVALAILLPIGCTPFRTIWNHRGELLSSSGIPQSAGEHHCGE